MFCIQKPLFQLLNQNDIVFDVGTYPGFPDAAILFIIRTMGFFFNYFVTALYFAHKVT